MMRLPNPSGVKISHPQMNSSRTMISNTTPNPMMKMPSVLSISNPCKKRFTRRKSTPASTTLANPPVKSPPSFLESFRVDEKPTEEAAIVIDEWMEDSVTGIVQNLKQAPLLVHVYPEFNRLGNNSKFGYKIDKAVQENWPIITKSTRKTKKSPIGLIFVDELLDEESSGDSNNNSNNNNAVVKSERRRWKAEADRITRAWGILVQRKGVKSGPSCYLLKTTRVEASSHFCLTKVTNFRETALKQLQDSWLLQQ